MTKKNKIKKPSATKQDSSGKRDATSLQDRALIWIVAHKWDFIIFASAVAVTSLFLFPGGLIEWSPGCDASFYARAGERVASIWKILPGFMFKFINGSYTVQDYYRMGFIDPSGIDTIFRAPSFALYLSFWILLFGNSLNVLVMSQLFLVALIYVQIYQVLLRQISKRASLIVTFVSMAYLPIHYGAAQTGVELFVALCHLTALRIYVSVCENPTRKKLFWLGFITVVVSAANSSVMYYMYITLLIVTVMLVVRYRDKLRDLYMFFILGLALPLLLLLSIYGRTNGKVGYMESGSGGKNLCAGQQYITNCYYTQGVYQSEWFVDATRKVSNSIDPRRWFVQWGDVSTDALKATFFNDFGNFLLYTVRKCSEIAFHAPRTSVQQINSYVFLQGSYLDCIHWLLVSAAFTGIILLRKMLDEKVFISGLFLYHMVIYGTSNMSTRYLLPLTPIYMVFAGAFFSSITSWSVNRKVFVKVGLIATIMTGLVIWELPAFADDYYYVYEVKVLLLSLLALALIAVVFKSVWTNKIWPHTVVAGLVLFFCFCCFEARILTNKKFLSTSVTAEKTLKQEIDMNGLFALNDYDEFYLMFDTSLKTDSDDLTFRFNGATLEAEIVSDVSPIVYARFINKTWGKQEPKWSFMQIHKEIMATRNIIEISSCKKFRFNADYKSAKAPYMPSHLHFITSSATVTGWKKEKNIEKRAFLKENVMSLRRASSVDNKESPKNLRIYIVGKRKGAWCLPRRYEKLNQAHPFYLALLRLQDRGVVRYKSELSADDVPAESPVLSVLMGEMTSFYSGYDLF